MKDVPDDDDLRPPLGLPPGSVRAILSILITVQLWVLLSLPQNVTTSVPLNLYFLLAMVMIFFISHGSTIAYAKGLGNPLYLPRGVIRFLLLGGTIGILVYQYQFDSDRLWSRLTPSSDQIPYFPQFLLSTGIGFLLGILLRPLPSSRSPFLQTIMAWLSIVSAIGMTAEVIIQCLIMPHIVQEINLLLWQSILTGMVSFYFSLRS
ncbi:hypothetical protein KIH39_12210 [Telmatocola sphagniphila]|jgi:hypothetical protein|uniref:Uncharacterized protein n=1 Tax=Telmatocola sphagniphila TaxID=1123043 RepID=A0A8E6BA70_9BACT|nr:hypothetical protein [Telmatocola sphagniphila]QVL34633.1 hypothetical protein KIH39_12210 [Telmatocola sphagniphila]